MEKIRTFLQRRPVASGAAVLAVMQLLASLAGLVRDRTLAQTFPPGIDQLDTVSVYIAAFRPSDFLFQFFIMSMFSVALVPLLAGHLAKGRGEEMDRLLSSVLIIATSFFAFVAIVFLFTFDFLAPSLVGFQGASLELYIRFAKMACLSNLLFVIGNAFGQYLVTRRLFISYGIAPILYTVGTIGGTVFLTSFVGPYGPMIGTLAGVVVFVLINTFGAWRSGFRFHLPHFLHGDLREMGWLMLPRMAALGALQAQLLFFDTFASHLPAGSVTVNAYARNFQSAAVGVIGIALAQSVFSLLSQAVARKDLPDFRRTLRKGAGLTLGLSVLAAIVLASVTGIAASIMHLTDAGVRSAFTMVLIVYALSIPFDCMNQLLLRAIYATKHTALPAAIGVLNGFLSIGIAWSFSSTLGVRGIAMGFLLGQAIQAILLGFCLVGRMRTMKMA